MAPAASACLSSNDILFLNGLEAQLNISGHPLIAVMEGICDRSYDKASMDYRMAVVENRTWVDYDGIDRRVNQSLERQQAWLDEEMSRYDLLAAIYNNTRPVTYVSYVNISVNASNATGEAMDLRLRQLKMDMQQYVLDHSGQAAGTAAAALPVPADYSGLIVAIIAIAIAAAVLKWLGIIRLPRLRPAPAPAEPQRGPQYGMPTTLDPDDAIRDARVKSMTRLARERQLQLLEAAMRKECVPAKIKEMQAKAEELLGEI
jgi:hypothetical protein